MDVRPQRAKHIAPGPAVSGLIGAGAGVGAVLGPSVPATSRNPASKDDLFRSAILGFASTEAVGLLAITMSFLLLFI